MTDATAHVFSAATGAVQVVICARKVYSLVGVGLCRVVREF